MPLKLYYRLASPCVRSVVLTLKILNIPYDIHPLNLATGEQLSEEFLKINPQHTLPTIEDDGFIIWDSHAINAYLVNKYARNDHPIYPKDPKIRAVIDQRLYFENGVLFPCNRNTVIGILFKKTITKITDDIINNTEEAYQFLEKFLEKTQYVAGNNFTIADFSYCTTLSNLKCLIPIKKEKFPLIIEYLKRCDENIPYLKEINDRGVKMFREVFGNVNFELAPQ